MHELSRGRPLNHAFSGLSGFLKAFNFVYALVFLLILGSLLNHFEIEILGFTPRPEHLFIAVIFPIFVLYRVLKKSALFRVDASFWLVAAWISVNFAASALNAPSPSESYTHVVRFFLLVLTYLIVANAARSAEDWGKLLKTWILLGTVETIYGIVAALSAYAFGTSFGVGYNFQVSGATNPLSPYGTLYEPNIFGGFTGSLYMVFLAILLWQRKSDSEIVFRNTYLYTGLFLTATATIFTYTRAIWLALAIGIFLVCVVAGGRWRRIFMSLLLNLPIFIAATLVVLAVTVLNIDTLDGNGDTVNGRIPTPEDRLATLGRLNTDNTFQWRLETFQLGIQDWSRHPIIGNGTGSFSQLHGPIRGSEAWIPIMIIHTLVDTGIVGLVIQGALLGVVFWRTLKAVQRLPSDSPLRIGLIALSAGMFVLLIAYQAADASWLAGFWIHLGLISNGVAVAETLTRG